ncbi:AIF_collapsed_G0032040.mRNA.1.CDS.1 [Saccharomyces cerevisiae]|nr:AIF_collapsed_G0032040.mRNA.1.CDS.1 [Saccharomyces cerevisiae]
MTKDEPPTLPLPGTPTLAAVSLDMIDDKSCLMDANRLDLIRRDRTGGTRTNIVIISPKSPKLFQAINGLWSKKRLRKGNEKVELDPTSSGPRPFNVLEYTACLVPGACLDLEAAALEKALFFSRSET